MNSILLNSVANVGAKNQELTPTPKVKINLVKANLQPCFLLTNNSAITTETKTIFNIIGNKIFNMIFSPISNYLLHLELVYMFYLLIHPNIEQVYPNPPWSFF